MYRFVLRRRAPESTVEVVKFEQWGLPYPQGGGAASDLTTDPANWLNRLILPTCR